MIKLTGPVLALILVVRDDVTTGNKLGDVDHTVESGVDHQTGDETVCCAVAKGNEHYGNKCRHCVANVTPVH